MLVNNGNYYENKIIELNRNLDFNNSSCYKNATDTTTYGDYNGDGRLTQNDYQLMKKHFRELGIK